jgi:hypothetical protein
MRLLKAILRYDQSSDVHELLGEIYLENRMFNTAIAIAGHLFEDVYISGILIGLTLISLSSSRVMGWLWTRAVFAAAICTRNHVLRFSKTSLLTAIITCFESSEGMSHPAKGTYNPTNILCATRV